MITRNSSKAQHERRISCKTEQHELVKVPTVSVHPQLLIGVWSVGGFFIVKKEGWIESPTPNDEKNKVYANKQSFP